MTSSINRTEDLIARNGPAGNPQSYGEICVMRRDGAAVRCLTDNPFEDATPSWPPR